ncbi:MAG: iron ABC transporter permease [Prevotellaceae bacterium]|jgi:iron complex transport system permease protein|nr:iron ABC transporter permease [Prevotellaceae bacterium]
MKKRNYIITSVLVILLVLFFVADLLFGSISISLSDFFKTIFGTQNDRVVHEIIVNYRLTKALTAVLAGAGLSVSGLLLQTLFRNPLADPYILGVSSGASLGVAVVVLASSLAPAVLLQSGWAQIVAAIVGASAVLALVVFFSFRVRSVVSLLIIGIMFGAIASAIVTILQNMSNPDFLKIFIAWTFGSLSSVTWSYMIVLLPVTTAGILFACLLQKSLDGLLLGEKYAASLGISVKRMRLLIVLTAGILSGSLTAFTGPIAFVGVAVPHLARGLFRTSQHRILLTACILCGAILLLACDIITQIPASALPLNTVCALLGAPVIIYILLKNK